MTTKISKFGSRFFFAGVLGLVVSALFAEYTSQFLYAHYQGWLGWRSMTGSDPNFITSIIQKISWAFFFFASFFMTWKLDSFFIPSKQEDKKVGEDEEEEVPSASAEKETTSEKDNKEEDEGPKEPKSDEGESTEEGETDPETEEIEEDENQFNFADLKYAETLGLKEPFTLEDIKPAYRKIIAQYHPDRVAAMGDEIKEVAEKKAKEINRAYQYFQKKFDLD